MTHFNPPSEHPQVLNRLEMCSRAAIITSRVHTGYQVIVIGYRDGLFYEWTIPSQDVTPSTALRYNDEYSHWAAALGGLLVMSSVYGKDADDGKRDLA